MVAASAPVVQGLAPGSEQALVWQLAVLAEKGAEALLHPVPDRST